MFILLSTPIRRYGCVCILLLIASCTIVIPLGANKPALQEVVVRQGTHDKIAIIPINGVIQSGQNNNLLSPSAPMLADFATRLNLAANDAKVKAVMLTINSPGGSVAASDLLHHQISSFRKIYGKPVVAQILDLGASGGYYAAIAANQVYAMPSSVTCSIGVIVVQLSANELLSNNGLKIDAYTSGRSKDAGAPYKASSEEDKRIYTNMVAHFSSRFFSLVAQSRNTSSVQQEQYQQGAICTAQQALELNLIDGIAYPNQTIKTISKQWRLTPKPTLVSYQHGKTVNPNFYSASNKTTHDLLNNKLATSLTSRLIPGVYYLAPGW